MTTVIDYLRRFNRKERYYLVKWAVGSFDLSDDCRRELNTKAGLRIPQDAFVAMDYHLNWLYAAVYLGCTQRQAPMATPYPNPVIDEESGSRMIQGNQEDVDLVIAYKEGDVTHIVLVEAKGDTPWSNSQMRSKALRLGSIFRIADETIEPHLVFLSPNRPLRLRHEDWPDWMRPDGTLKWVQMPWPDDLETVFRCDQAGKKSGVGGYWTRE